MLIYLSQTVPYLLNDELAIFIHINLHIVYLAQPKSNVVIDLFPHNKWNEVFSYYLV